MQNSDQTSFKIVLTGFPKPGVSIQEAEQNLSKLLPIEFSKIQLLLQGTPTTIKRNLTIENIERYRQALSQIGVEFEIVADMPEPLSTNITGDQETLSDISSKKYNKIYVSLLEKVSNYSGYIKNIDSKKIIKIKEQWLLIFKKPYKLFRMYVIFF